VTGVPADPQTTASLLPEGAVLLHIGPYKTGSTAIQSALFDRRDELEQFGVAYPGNWRRLFGIGHALLRWAPRGHEVPDIDVWDGFAAKVRAMDDRRVCLSTEDFGRIRNQDRAQKIVADLGPERLHVVAVARAYHRVLPSHWQERVKSHITTSYEDWLREVLGDDPTVETHRAFHTSHDVRWMTSMWLPELPPERFTIVVTDDTDRRLLPRTFEQMLGLPDEFLTLDDAANASLSFQATEMLRAVNAGFEQRGWSDRAYTQLLQKGLVPAMQARGRGPGETPLPPLPSWALEEVRRQSEDRIAAIRETGVNVVGDTSVLLPPDDADAPASVPPVHAVSLESAATAVLGVLERAVEIEEQARARQAKGKRGRPRGGGPRDALVSETSGRALLRELARRQRVRLRRG
jgi:hypothetical protein